MNGDIIAGSSLSSRISCITSSSNLATVWCKNNLGSYGIGVDHSGLGHIYTGYSNSKSLITFKDIGIVGIGFNFDIQSINFPRDTNYVLYVEGSIAARELKITSNNFPDYVFSKNYKLMPLKKLENYLIENKHLPDIPSLNSVNLNGGFEIGEMQTKLLLKIVELTLYIIEQDKRIEALEAKSK